MNINTTKDIETMLCRAARWTAPNSALRDICINQKVQGHDEVKYALYQLSGIIGQAIALNHEDHFLLCLLYKHIDTAPMWSKLV